MTTHNTCPICYKRSRDGLPCWPCWRKTEARLERLPDLWRELQITRHRLDRLQQPGEYVTSGRPERPLPWNESAARVAQRITDGVAERNGIVGWVRITVEDLGAPRPADTIPAMAHHLLVWSPKLRTHTDAAEFHADVWGWTAAIMAAVDPPEIRKVPAGRCPETHEDAPCPGDVSLIVAGRGFDAPTIALCEPRRGYTHEQVCGHEWASWELARLGARIKTRRSELAEQERRARGVVA